MFQILVEFDSSIDRIRRGFYLYSRQMYLADLAAAQSLCAKRGPNKKNGGHNVVQGTGKGIGGRRHPARDERPGESPRRALCHPLGYREVADRMRPNLGRETPREAPA